MLQRIRQTDCYASGGNLKLIYSITIQLPLSAEVLSLPKVKQNLGLILVLLQIQLLNFRLEFDGLHQQKRTADIIKTTWKQAPKMMSIQPTLC